MSASNKRKRQREKNEKRGEKEKEREREKDEVTLDLLGTPINVKVRMTDERVRNAITTLFLRG